LFLVLTNRFIVSAVDKRISAGAFRTRAARNVVDDVTPGSLTASSRARINAALIDASLSAVTIGIEHTLRSASWVRIPEVVLHACAASVSANGVGSARWWITRILGPLDFLD
jgi:hypothetical protein